MNRPNSRLAALHRFQEWGGAFVLLATVFVPAAIAAAADGPTAWLQIGDDPAAMLNQGGIKHRDPAEYEQFRKTQAALIKSPTVLRQALNDPAIANLKLIQDQAQAIEWLKENLSVIIPLESEVLTVSLNVGDRAEAAIIVNAVKDSYLKNVVEVKRMEINKQYQLFDTQVQNLRAELSEKRHLLAELSTQLGLNADADGLARERFSRLLELATKVRSSVCDIELQAIASRIRMEDSEISSTEKHKAKIDLSIAEAQLKFLNETKVRINQELAEVTLLATKGTSSSVDELQAEIKQKQDLVQNLETQLQKLSLVLRMPQRVTTLMNATGTE